MVEKEIIENNADATRALEALLARLSDADLQHELGGGWDVSTALAHAAFWDRRAVQVFERWVRDGTPYRDQDDDILNDCLLDEWRALPPRVAANLAIAAAHAVDSTVAVLPDAVVAAVIAGGNDFLLHGGQNASFPGVPIYVQADEYTAAHQPNYTIQRWVDFPEAQYRQIEGDKEIAPGIRILSARRHTPGHQALLVETTSGPVILAGQAIYSKIEYEHLRDTGELAPEEPQDDPENYLASAQRLIQLAARRVFFSHDSSFYEAP